MKKVINILILTLIGGTSIGDQFQLANIREAHKPSGKRSIRVVAGPYTAGNDLNLRANW